MVEIDMRIKGVAECVRNIHAIGTESEKQLGFAMARVVLRVTKTAREKAPHATGYLKSTINPIPAVKKRPGREVKGWVSATAHYAAVQEFGGRGIEAKRYMAKGLALNGQYIRDQFEGAIIKAALTIRDKNKTRGK